MFKTVYFLSALGLFAAGVLHAAVYTCKDAQGVTHLTNIPCEEGRSPGAQRDQTEVPPGLTYDTIREASVSMTSAQFDAFVQGIKNKELGGRGWVHDIREELSIPWQKRRDIYKAYVDLYAPPSGKFLFTQQITLQLPKSMALQITKGQFVVFKGKIESVTCRSGSCTLALREGEILR